MDSKKIYRDSLFRSYFRDKENFVQLCNAVTGLNLKAKQLSENSVEDILFSNLRNDVSFSAGENCFVFFEHQSTRNFNMPLRMLFYLSLLYRETIKPDLIYRTRMISLPAPKFFVFYNGKEACPEMSTLKLSDAFSMTGDIELSVKVYNINYNKNFRLIRDCLPVHDYSFFVNRVEMNRAKGMSRDEAIIEAINWCIANGIMRDYLKARMKEIFMMVNLIWNEEDARKSYLEQGREEGREQGREEGREQGREEGREQGREEGREQGREEGREQGREEGVAIGERKTSLENVRNLMDSLHLTAKAAMNLLRISPEMQRELEPLI